MLAVFLGLPYNSEERARREALSCSAQHAVLRARASELRHVPLSELKRTVRIIASKPASFLCRESRAIRRHCVTAPSSGKLHVLLTREVTSKESELCLPGPNIFFGRGAFGNSRTSLSRKPLAQCTNTVATTYSAKSTLPRCLESRMSTAAGFQHSFLQCTLSKFILFYIFCYICHSMLHKQLVC